MVSCPIYLFEISHIPNNDKSNAGVHANTKESSLTIVTGCRRAKIWTTGAPSCAAASGA